jgi:hypothetical protein
MLPVILSRNLDRSISTSNIIPPPPNALELFGKNTMYLYWELKREAHLDHSGEIDASNGYMVEFNRTLTACLKCNTCVSLLGDDAQVKSATFYMLKYMTKDPVAAASLVSGLVKISATFLIPGM